MSDAQRQANLAKFKGLIADMQEKDGVKPAAAKSEQSIFSLMAQRKEAWASKPVELSDAARKATGLPRRSPEPAEEWSRSDVTREAAE